MILLRTKDKPDHLSIILAVPVLNIMTWHEKYATFNVIFYAHSLHKQSMLAKNGISKECWKVNNFNFHYMVVLMHRTQWITFDDLINNKYQVNNIMLHENTGNPVTIQDKPTTDDKLINILDANQYLVWCEIKLSHTTYLMSLHKNYGFFANV